MPPKSRFGRAMAYLSSPKAAAAATFSPRITRSRAKARELVTHGTVNPTTIDTDETALVACDSNALVLFPSDGLATHPSDALATLPSDALATLPSENESAIVPFDGSYHDFRKTSGKMPNKRNIVLFEVPGVNVTRSLNKPNLLGGNRGDLGTGTWSVVLESIDDQKVQYWYEFHVHSVLKCKLKVPAHEEANKFLTGNAGKQNTFLIDQIDVSLYAAPGMVVTGPMFRRFCVEFPSKNSLDMMFTHSSGLRGLEFLEEWYDNDGRFVRGPSKPAHAIDNSNLMDIDEIEGRAVEQAERARTEEELKEEYEEYGDFVEESQPWTF